MSIIERLASEALEIEYKDGFIGDFAKDPAG
jgi:hypothetical protein